MRVHFIAIGGAVMHNLAIALLEKGYIVTGSDDEIFEPSRSHLVQHGLLPESYGWHPENITPEIDYIILGMHARADNPELKKARDLGLKIMSFPEYLYEQTKTKKRIVVAGSHGKTTTTAMIMHVFRSVGLKFDYMAGSQIDGFDTMVGLSDESTVAVLEGDEYLTSAIDRRPKFHLYMPDIAILNGIAWDHMNVFPTFENYVEQFRIFISKISVNGALIYFEDDPIVKKIATETEGSFKKIPYRKHSFFQNNKGFFVETEGGPVQLQIFGGHNMQNLSAAKEACLAVGISEDDFYNSIQTFVGTSKRLQKLGENEKGTIFLDFAHSPSKVQATVEAVRSRYPEKDIIACLELHTYSSLSHNFLPLYEGTLNEASEAFVYFNPHAIALKKLEPVTREEVKKAFGKENLLVFDNSSDLFSVIKTKRFRNPVYLLMSSGDFDGYDINKLIE
jgi:UDP-N-acetylmuramate: L-alanyl-gamma-D-glutamyl-meso-diaminopimelate ligase